jgi:virulence factor
MLKVGFIGAGGRSRGAHYPNVHRLEGVSVEGVAELDQARGQEMVDKYGIPRLFENHEQLLDAVDLDAVYCVMNEVYVLEPALACMNAGKHVFVEKPPGANTDETQQLVDAAEANGVHCMVGFQRRFSAVTVEAMRLVEENGPATLVTGSFNKWLTGGPGNTSTLWNDVSHIVDLVRYMSGSEPTEVHAYRDSHGTDWRNCYTGMIRFENNATGVIMGNRASGGRVLRSELHGIGVGCYMDVPESIEILEAGSPPRVLTGAELSGAEPGGSDRYEGVLSMHEHFVDCIRSGATPNADIRDAVHSMRLVDRLEGTA